MSKIEIFAHIGLPKTGTKFLQDYIFPKLNLNYIGHYHLQGNITNGKNLISDETLMGDFIGDINFKNNKITSYDIFLKRFKRLFPDVKIILVIRDKEEWVHSCYHQFMAKPERRKLVKNFNDYYFKYFNDGNIDEMIDFLNDTFNQVLILSYDLLKKDYVKFVKFICNFMDVVIPDFVNKKFNVSFANKHYNFLRYVDKLPYNHISNIVDGIFKRIN